MITDLTKVGWPLGGYSIHSVEIYRQICTRGEAWVPSQHAPSWGHTKEEVGHLSPGRASLVIRFPVTQHRAGSSNLPCQDGRSWSRWELLTRQLKTGWQKARGNYHAARLVTANTSAGHRRFCAVLGGFHQECTNVKLLFFECYKWNYRFVVLRSRWKVLNPYIKVIINCTWQDGRGR